MSHTATHPTMHVPDAAKTAFPDDVSFRNDECPCFFSAARREFLYWAQDSDDARPEFSIWRADDAGNITDEELFQGFSVEDLQAYLAGRP